MQNNYVCVCLYIIVKFEAYLLNKNKKCKPDEQ